jgi:hypothetical protein
MPNLGEPVNAASTSKTVVAPSDAWMISDAEGAWNRALGVYLSEHLVSVVQKTLLILPTRQRHATEIPTPEC